MTGSPWWNPLPLGGRQRIDKLDLLFAIDNSPSMGDKQDLLAKAVPVLVGRLLNPNCVSTATSGPASACKIASDCSSLGAGAQCDVNGNGGSGQCFVPGDNKGSSLQCTTIPGTKAEFAPVADIHIGIVSSSLGGGGSPDVCVPSGTNDPTHQNDKGHLLNRTLVNNADGPPINNAKPVDGNGGNFLAWLPASDPMNQGETPPNVTPYVDDQATPMVTDFQSLVSGVQQRGCGLEAQLESWYRFLIQPDPWDSIETSSDNPPRASYSGVDATLLKMRHDFLRPDSLVAIIQLTDEEDSWSDPLWLGGYGWTARTANFPGGPGGGAGPMGTSECDVPVDANDPVQGPNDPNCTSCAFPGSKKPNGQLIGSDPKCSGPQNGWWSAVGTSVPIDAADGLNVRYGSQYMRQRYGFDNQHNVQRYIDGLRLTTAPDRDHEAHDYQQYAATQRNCTNPLFAGSLPDGSDTSPGALCNLKLGARTPDLVFYALLGGVPDDLVQGGDWTKMLGKDPEHYVLDGIDPRMIQSITPRPGAPDDWNTLTSVAGIDLEYACTFTLPTPKDCTAPANAGACDCTSTANGSPVCSTTTPTTQVKGKAYPTIRELRVAKALGDQSFVASICAKDTTSAVTAPTFGYNPAMQAIVDRLKSTLSHECLGAALPMQNGQPACLMLVEFPFTTDQSTACNAPGMSQPPASLLEQFQSSFRASLGDAGGQPTPALCVLQEVAACGSAPGWCYETNVGGCAQRIDFTPGSLPSGVTLSLACSAGVTN